MSRSAWAAALIVIASGACKKSSADQQPPTSAPSTNDTVQVPGAPPPSMKGASPATPAGGGTADRFKLKPEEGTLAITVPADAKAGAETTATIKVTPNTGYHVNVDYPIKLELTAPDGVKLAHATLVAGGHEKSKGDADALDETQLVLPVKMTAAAAGTYTVNGTFNFAVCDKDQCLAKKEQVAINLAAK
ncbi:MAG TPA: hypothetical protein VGM88_16375 [Kofleriaceae bacterium]